MTFYFMMCFLFAMQALNGQQDHPVDWLRELPRGLEPDHSRPGTYLMTTDYLEYDLSGRFKGKMRVTAEYTCGLENGAVRWNKVRVARSQEPGETFPEGELQESMEGFTYVPSEKVVTEEFFREIPQIGVELKNLVWDMLGLEVFAYRKWDDLELNREIRAEDINSVVDLAGQGSFENRDVRLTWLGITRINGEVCAIIKYSAMNNLLNMETEQFRMKGRSHYWGEVFVSLKDRQIEYATLAEDVITDIVVPGYPENILGYTVRHITLKKIL